ncbi:MAG: hypothetical protein WCK37_04915 [Candidatus Falkowbacteria bacterium]
MVDPDLQNAFSQLQPIKLIGQAQQEIAKHLSVVAPSLWETSKVYIVGVILMILIIKFWERGIGSLVYNFIYIAMVIVLIWIFDWAIIFNSWFEFLSVFSYIATRFLLVRFGIWK